MPGSMHHFFEWLLRASWQAAVIVVLILLVYFVFGRKLSPQWRHALWMLVIIRLMLPALPSSDASIFNLQRLVAREQPLENETAVISNLPVGESPAPAVMPVAEPSSVASPTTSIPEPPAATHSIAASSPAPEIAPRRRSSFEPGLVLAAVWFSVVVGLMLRVTIQNILFFRRIRGAPIITNPEVLALLSEVRRAMGVTRDVRLAESEHVSSPALYGFWRPLLLLPAGLTGQFGQEELRHIFLHELAHVKRHDMLVQWVITGLGILHWFNPVLWFAWRRMAADRELACDALALARSGDSASEAYGQTILRLLEQQHSMRTAPANVLGIIETRSGIFRRIRMIAAFGRSYSRLAAVIALIVLACVGMTDAQSHRLIPPEKAVGRIVGRVVLDGPRPLDRLIDVKGEAAERLGTNRVLSRQFEIDDAGGLANALASIREGAQIPSAPPPRPVTLTITPAGLVPRLLAVKTNQQIQLQNVDSVEHRIYVFASNGKLDGTTSPIVVRGNSTTMLTFAKPQTFVMLVDESNTHLPMHVAVLDHPFFAVSRSDGSFELPELPAGRYTVELHHPRTHAESTVSQVIPAANSYVMLNTTPKWGLYSVQAGGGYNGMSTLPESNKLRISLWRDNEGEVHGRIKNEEEFEILVWNVRFQVRSAGVGTDGFGWDTVVDEYPWPKITGYPPRRVQDLNRTTIFQRSIIPPGEEGEFFVDEVSPLEWRICVLYQIQSQPRRQCEAISNIIAPLDNNPPATADQAYRRIGLSMLRVEVEKVLGQPGRVDEKGVYWYTYPPAAQTAKQKAAASAVDQIGVEWNPVHGMISKTLRRAGE